MSRLNSIECVENSQSELESWKVKSEFQAANLGVKHLQKRTSTI